MRRTLQSLEEVKQPLQVLFVSLLFTCNKRSRGVVPNCPMVVMCWFAAQLNFILLELSIKEDFEE